MSLGALIAPSCGVDGALPHAHRSGKFPSLDGAIARVAVLFQGCRPAAVSWSVWAIVIDAVNAVSRRWPRPHVSRKRLEVVPLRAHGDASPTVRRVGDVRGAVAALMHAAPLAVERSAGHAVFGAGLSESLFGYASTASRSPATQMLAADCSCDAAVAHGMPVRIGPP